MKNVNMKIMKNFVAIASKRGRYTVTRKASMTQNLTFEVRNSQKPG
jgi:hypothetical protein